MRFSQEVAECRCCLELHGNDETMVKRTMAGRVDQIEQTARKRVAAFRQAAEPVLHYFSKLARLVRVDAEPEVDQVYLSVSTLFGGLTGLTELKKAQVVFVLGGPGSGKGTQSEKMVEKWGFEHLSTGDLLRAKVQSGSAEGEQLQATMQSGQLVSLETVLALLREAMLCGICEKRSSRFLVDGFPRELQQAVRFESEVLYKLYSSL